MFHLAATIGNMPCPFDNGECKEKTWLPEIAQKIVKSALDAMDIASKGVELFVEKPAFLDEVLTCDGNTMSWQEGIIAWATEVTTLIMFLAEHDGSDYNVTKENFMKPLLGTACINTLKGKLT